MGSVVDEDLRHRWERRYGRDSAEASGPSWVGSAYRMERRFLILLPTSCAFFLDFLSTPPLLRLKRNGSPSLHLDETCAMSSVALRVMRCWGMLKRMRRRTRALLLLLQMMMMKMAQEG